MASDYRQDVPSAAGSRTSTKSNAAASWCVRTGRRSVRRVSAALPEALTHHDLAVHLRRRPHVEHHERTRADAGRAHRRRRRELGEHDGRLADLCQVEARAIRRRVEHDPVVVFGHEARHRRECRVPHADGLEVAEARNDVDDAHACDDLLAREQSRSER
jgi:hypothetical protein